MAITRGVLVEFIESELGISTVDLDDEAPLFSSGMIDSFSLVSLLNFLEHRGGFTVDPDDVTLDNLDSLARILQYAATKAS